MQVGDLVLWERKNIFGLITATMICGKKQWCMVKWNSGLADWYLASTINVVSEVKSGGASNV